MRDERTDDEQRAIDSIKQYCLTRGLSVDEDADITDRPDALLVVSGRRVACECTICTPEKILRLHGITLQEGEPYRAFLPIEPHMWVRNAIAAKNPKIADYSARTNADEVWLVLHGKAGYFESIVDAVASDHFEIAMMAAHQNLHSFDYIFIVSSSGEVACIYSSAESAVNVEKFKKWRVTAIPVGIYGIGRATSTRGANGNGELCINLNAPHNLIKCQPLDKDFSVDYSGAHILDFANISPGNPGPQLVATRKVGTSTDR